MLERGTLRRRDDGGAAAVEFALVMIPLLYLVFGVISYGYMLSFRQSISQASAEGARAAAVAPAGLTDTELKTRAREAINETLRTYDISCTAAGVLNHGASPAGACTISNKQTCTGSTTSAQCIQVTLNYTYDDDPLLPDVGYGVVLPDNLRFVSEVQVS